MDNKLRKGYIWTEEEDNLLRELAPGRTIYEISEELRKLGIDRTSAQVRNRKKYLGITSGQVQRPSEKSRATQFKAGNLPHNTKPIGYERLSKSGYIEVKVKMRPTALPDGKRCNDNFVPKHKLVWEAANGPVPEGCIVVFKDGNKQNITLENLSCITRRQNAIMNRGHIRCDNPDAFEACLAMADIKSAVSKRKKEVKRSNGRKRK